MTDYAQQYATRRRDARLRHALLEMLHKSRSNEDGGWVTARFLQDVLGYMPLSDRPDTEDQLLGLLRDLVGRGYADERDEREYQDEPFSLATLSFRISGQGVGFVAGAEPADPMIEDGRRPRPPGSNPRK